MNKESHIARMVCCEGWPSMIILQLVCLLFRAPVLVLPSSCHHRLISPSSSSVLVLVLVHQVPLRNFSNALDVCAGLALAFVRWNANIVKRQHSNNTKQQQPRRMSCKIKIHKHKRVKKFSKAVAQSCVEQDKSVKLELESRCGKGAPE